jgi:uncharacterized protein
MQLTSFLVPSYTHMLQSMAGWLDKAAANAGGPGSDADALMTLRLAPDMYPLSAQVRFACFQAQEPMYRLREMAVPESLLKIREEGWHSNDNQGTFAEARDMLTNAIAFLSVLAPDALDAGALLNISLEMPNGIVFDMSGEQYARDWSLTQFYFHVTAGYAILRHYGVPLGKPDFVPHMAAYIRPGTLPG